MKADVRVILEADLVPNTKYILLGKGISSSSYANWNISIA